jgi:outer membrane lipopolysaccharide assembly protein LptE/RlpB
LPAHEHRAWRGASRGVSRFALLLAGALAICAAGCGYHVAGHSANLPSEWHTVEIPAFKNDTTRYRVEQKFTQAVIQEFLARTKYRIVQTAESADGVLSGEVLSIDTSPALFNATTGEVTATLVTVHVRISLADTKSEKIVYHNDDMVFRQEYQIATDVNTFFEEQDPALERMSRDLASHIVSNLLEGF